MHRGKIQYGQPVLPADIRLAVEVAAAGQDVEEIRIRAGYPVSVRFAKGERETGLVAKQSDIDAVIALATGASAYAARESMKSGFISAAAGVRIGLCGTAVTENGEVTGFRDITSLNIRVPHEVKGAACEAVRSLAQGGSFSCLIISPPGGGKTTFLRDMIRVLSDEYMLRVGVCDERGEIAPTAGGQLCFDVGRRTDVMRGCKKADGVMMLLRAMNPQVIALDEITAQSDARAAVYAANCGACTVATAHAGSVEELLRRGVYIELLTAGVFKKAVVIEMAAGVRRYKLEDIM